MLVAVAAVLVRLADVVAIPYPIVLVLGGIGIGALPGGPVVELEPEVVFLVFLPPLLQSAGFYAAPQELRARARARCPPWSSGSRLATMGVVAFVAEAVIPQLSLPEALVLGRDRRADRPGGGDRDLRPRRRRPTASGCWSRARACSTTRAALVAYRVALTAVLAGTFSEAEAALELLVARRRRDRDRLRGRLGGDPGASSGSTTHRSRS